MMNSNPKYHPILISDRKFVFKLRNGFRILAVGLAALHTWAAVFSQSMNADGINYLDIGDAYFRGDWENAINPVWPPLYSWILGLVNLVFKPSMEWEFPLVHVLNFVIFLGTMVSFEFMWTKLRMRTQNKETGSITLPDWAWWALGYALFIWTSLNLIQIWAVTPDMLMAALLYLAAGLIIKIRNDSQDWQTFALLGIILGLGYLTKTFMFSIALVFLGICLILVYRTRSLISKFLLTVILFLLICLPFIVVISVKIEKLTIGDAGAVTYLRYVDGIPFPHWQGDPENQIELAHPSRLINQSPPIYEFGEPIGGTYPISTDPSYWYEGVNLPFNIGNQLNRFFISSIYYFDLFFQYQGVLLASVAALYIMGRKIKVSFYEVLHRWILVIPAVIAFGLYGMVLVSGRYIGSFLMLFWANILANINMTDTIQNRTWLKVLSILAVVGLMVNILLFNFEGYNRLNPTTQFNSHEFSEYKPPKQLEVAQVLRQLDIKAGDKIAVIGYGFDSFWARLARVQIVAEMLETDAAEFWFGDIVLRQNVLQVFDSTGAKAVVAEYVPEYARMDGWHPVGHSNYFIYRFDE